MDFTKLTDYLDSLHKVGIPGCHVCVWQDHKPVYEHITGYCDEKLTEPMKGNEVYWLYSVSKLYLAVSIMRLKEAGKLSLEDPVAKYLPAYEKITVREGENIVPARAPITFRQLLAMQSGMDYLLDTPGITGVLKRNNGHGTTRELVDAMAEDPLNFHPGDHYSYSLSHDVLGAVVEVVSGMTLGEYYAKNIFEPLDMPTMSFKMTAEKRARLAARFEYNDENHTSRPVERDGCAYVLSPEYESAGAGLIGDVADYMKFADALANDGVGANGYRLISRESIDEMRTNELKGPWSDFCDRHVVRAGYGYGLGVATMIDQVAGASLFGTARSPVGQFSWDSAAGAWVMVDVENKLCAFYAQHVLKCHYSYDVIHPAVRDLIYDGLSE